MNTSTDVISRLLISVCCYVYGIIIIQNSNRDTASRYFGYSEMSLGLWYMFSGLQNLVINYESAMMIRSFIIIAGELASVSIYLYSILTNSLKSKHHKYFYLASYSVPIILIVVTFFCVIFLGRTPFYKTVKNGVKIVQDIHSYPKTGLYLFHCLFCYSVVGITIYNFIKNSIKHFDENKRFLLVISTGIIIFIIPNIYRTITELFFLYNVDRLSKVFETFSFFLMSTISFFALYLDENEKSVSRCKISFYESSGLPIFILSKTYKLLQANSAADDFMNIYEIKVKKFDCMEDLFPKSKMQILGSTDTTNDNEFYISTVKNRRLYYARKEVIRNSQEKIIGYYIFLSNIDLYMPRLKQLEDKAYKDELTQCPKRDALMVQINSLLQMKDKNYLVFTCRINNIDHLNETIGLTKTDNYIKSFSMIVYRAINMDKFREDKYKENVLYKLTSSAFVFIIQEGQEDKSKELIKEIKNQCTLFSRSKSEPIKFSIGYSVASYTNRNIENILKTSYSNMLLNTDSKKNSDLRENQSIEAPHLDNPSVLPQ